MTGKTSGVGLNLVVPLPILPENPKSPFGETRNAKYPMGPHGCGNLDFDASHALVIRNDN